MAVPQYRDEALVILNSRNPPSSLAFPTRRLFLTKGNSRVAIGRTSRRNNAYTADTNNAWFDSPVMSREHAYVKLDVNKQKVYIMDTGSLHGTYKNDHRLSPSVSSHLDSGDVLRFGIPIDRGADKYSPCMMEATVTFGTADPDNRTKVFTVPDGSDVEGASSEDERSDRDGSIRNSSDMLRRFMVRRSNDHYPISNVRGDHDHTSNALPPPPYTSQPAKGVTVIDLSSPSPEPRAQFSPLSLGPEETSVFDDEASDEGGENDGHINAPTVGSSCMTKGPVLEQTYRRGSSVSHVSSDYYPNRHSLDDDEQDEFEERDEFESREGEYELVRESPNREDWSVAEVASAAKEFSPVPSNRDISLPPLAAFEGSAGTSFASLGHSQMGPFGPPISAAGLGFHYQPPSIQPPKTPWPAPYDAQLHHKLFSAPNPICSRPLSFTSQPQETAAEMMGSKTGKRDYFVARDENRKQMARAPSFSGLDWANGVSSSRVTKPLDVLSEANFVLPAAAPSPREPYQLDVIIGEPSDVESSQHEEYQADGSEADGTDADGTDAQESEAGESEADESEAEESEPGESHADGSQVEDFQADDSQAEESEPEGFGVEECQAEECQATECQAEKSQAEEPQAEEPQPEESQAADTQEEPSPEDLSQGDDAQSNSVQIEPCTHEPMELGVSKWAASGTQFLNTPPKEINSVQDDGPVLDETSACEFERSKKVAAKDEASEAPVECGNEAGEPIPMEICENPDKAGDAVDQAPVSTPKKRKAEEIETLAGDDEDETLKDERIHRAEKRARRRELKRSLEAKRSLEHQPEGHDGRPPKRLRRVAEVLGFAALGGVAVMSALIATAPTL